MFENKKMRKILVFPGGSEIALEIWKSLKDCKDITLFSAAADISNHSSFIFKNHFIVPSIKDPSWIEKLNKITTEHNIDYIFPAHDDVIFAISNNIEKLKAKVVSSPPETCLITRSKSKTYKMLENSVPVPSLYDNPEEINKFPLFIKPDSSQGSQDTHLINSKEELRPFFLAEKDFIFLEYLPGREYTIDCFSDRSAGLLFVGGRERLRTKSGISMNSSPVKNKIFRDYAEAISKKLSFHGAWFFQLKEDSNGTLKLLEVATRIAGTQCVHRVQGVNFSLLSIYEQERLPVQIMQNDYLVEVDRALVNRYKHSIRPNFVYVDFDDTLVQKGKVNAYLVYILFQFLNQGSKLILLTKHTGDLKANLELHRLTSLFDKIIHIKNGEEKSDLIEEKEAIFIDDSFSERKKVQKKLGIYTFDCSMIEMLVDEKV